MCDKIAGTVMIYSFSIKWPTFLCLLAPLPVAAAGRMSGRVLHVLAMEEFSAFVLAGYVYFLRHFVCCKSLVVSDRLRLFLMWVLEGIVFDFAHKPLPPFICCTLGI